MFELYNSCEKTCPDRVEIGRKTVEVNADFRNILKILAVFGDKKIPQIAQSQKLIEYFFKGDVEIAEIRLDEAFGAFQKFLNPPSEKNFWFGEKGPPSASDEERVKQFDYYFDSEEIYVSFLSEYSINLIRVDFLHWHEFSMLMRNLSKESAFRKKLEIRFLDLSVYSGNSRAFTEMAKAKKAAQLPVELTMEEMREIEAFDDVWGRI